MARVYNVDDRVQQASNTGTTGGTVFLTSLKPAGSFNFREVFANGAIVALYLFDETSGRNESSYGTLVYGAGDATTDSITTRTIIKSSSGIATPEPWGAGTRNAYCMVAGMEFLTRTNALGELTSPQVTTARSNLGLGTAATLNAGTAVNNLVQLLAGTPTKLPAVDGSNLVNLPAGTPSVPSGAVTNWYSAAAPSGWTRVTSVNDKVMMIVSAGSPGTVSAATWSGVSDLQADPMALSAAQMPTHTHALTYTLFQAGSGPTGVVETMGAGGSSATTGSAGSGATHSHAVSFGGAWRPPAAYMLLASKN